MLSTKAKIRTLLANSIHKLDLGNIRNRIIDRNIVKNVVLDDFTLPLKLASQTEGGFIRILATSLDNAKQISSILNENQDELGLRDVKIADSTFDYYPRFNNEPLFNLSVLVRVDPRVAFKSVQSTIVSNEYLKNSIVGNNYQPKRVVIDFSSPNVAKPFHFGHLKSTILGNFLANINNFVGNTVTKLNYLGDWGTQYGLLSLALDDSGSNEIPHKSPLKYLLDVYVKANERAQSDENFYTEARRRFMHLEDGDDPELSAKWRQIRDLSLAELKSSYDQFGVEFDVMDFESNYAKKAPEVVREMQSRNIAHELEDGVVYIDIEKNRRPLKVPLLKSDGASLYISRDIASAISRKETYNFDSMLYVAGSDQEKHFYSLREIIRRLGHQWADQLEHIKTGKVIGMSSRSGNIVLLSDIIDEATRRYIQSTNNSPTSKVKGRDQIQEVGKHLALSALFVYDLLRPRTANYTFNWDTLMMGGQRSGIQLQACHSRLCSLITNARRRGLEPLDAGEDGDSDAIRCLDASHLISILDEFESELYCSFQSMDASRIVNYGLTLCRYINRARRNPWLRVLDEPVQLNARSRLTLFERSQKQLELLIKLIGLKPLERI